MKTSLRTSNIKKSIKQLIKKAHIKFKIAVPMGGYPLHKNQPINPFFIIGSGRSGTTLLRRILIYHPKVCIPPETYVLDKCINQFALYNNLPWDHLVNLTLSTLEYHPNFSSFNITLRPLVNELYTTPKENRSLAHILDRFYHYYADELDLSCTIWGDKTPRNTYHLGLIHSVFPNAKYIHLIRHGIDVVYSYLRTGLRHGLVETAKRWENEIKLAQSFGINHPTQYIEVHYEELVKDPVEWIHKICNFLDIKYIEGMIKSSHTLTEQMGDVPKYDHFSKVQNPITTDHIGKGAESLSKEQIEVLKGIIGNTIRELGYKS